MKNPTGRSEEEPVAGLSKSEINCRWGKKAGNSLDLSALPIQTVQRPPAPSDLRLRAIFPADLRILGMRRAFCRRFGYFEVVWLRRANSAFVLKVIALT